MCSATSRAAASETPPGGNGTARWIDLLGNVDCAPTTVGSVIATPIASAPTAQRSARPGIDRFMKSSSVSFSVSGCSGGLLQRRRGIGRRRAPHVANLVGGVSLATVHRDAVVPHDQVVLSPHVRVH